jgi:hypothetical protein
MTAGLFHGGRAGHWGERTSNLDWCEENYVVTPYVAEWWNTVSNAGYVVLALYGLYYQAFGWRMER